LGDVDLQFDADWSAVVWLQEGMTRYFSVHEALDIAEAVTLTRLDGIPRSIPLVHGLLLAVGPLAARVFVRIMAREDNDWMRTRR
jgi:hypothetical protein